MGLEMQDSKISPHRPRGRRLAWRRLIVASVGVVMFLLWLGSSRVTMINSLIAPTGARSRPDSLGRNPSKTAEDRRVPLEAHIMSKCPDARDCLHDLILPTMQKIGDKVSFRLSFIGTYVFSVSFPPGRHTQYDTDHLDHQRIASRISMTAWPANTVQASV